MELRAWRNLGWALAAIWLLAVPEVGTAQNSSWVKTGVTGRLIYVPDHEGDRIPDFSMVGYGEGKREIPNNLPVLIHVDPIAGDNTAHIQSAINFAASQPMQANGFRGVVELGPGKFDVGGQLSITASGVVLRGTGGGDDLGTNTHIVSQNRSGSVGSTPVINIQGSSSGTTRGPQIQILDSRVPVGAQSFRVASTAGMQVGGMVEIFRPSTQPWIEELGMHLIPPDSEGNPRHWTAGSRNLEWHRTITRIEGNRIYIDAPITTALDAQWGGGTVRTYHAPNVIRNVGVENLRGQSLDVREETNESRTPSFVRFTRVVDGFARDLETRHFTYASVFTSEADGGRHITVDNVHSRLPAGEVTGGRRYTFAMDGQYSLVKNSSADSGRHDFVTGSNVVGPIVFVNSTTTNTRSDTGPHHRWGNGLLFDNLDINGHAINVQNRWTSGSGHGWAGANVVVWNSEANSFIVQSPPTAQSWLIGSTGTINAGNCHLGGASCSGYHESHGTRVTVGGEQSLYEAQLSDAADIREFHWTAGSGNWADAEKWDQEVTPGVYSVSMREYTYGDYDGFTFNGLNSPDEVFIDPCWVDAIEQQSAQPIVLLDQVIGDRNVALTMQHQLATNERVIHAYLALALKQSGDTVSDDFVQLFDATPQNTLNFDRLGWASQINATTPFVGVIDMGHYLDESQVQSGSVNVRVSDDTAVDWATYTVAVATPKADAVGATVFLDGGNVLVNSVVAPVGALQNGGLAQSELTISSGGRVTVNDSYVQSAAGALTVQLGGLGAGQFGTLIVRDTTQLAGTLAIELVDGFLPSAGHEFELVTATNGFGGTEFSNIFLPTLGGDLTWQVVYDSDSLLARVLGTTVAGDLNGDGSVTPADWTAFKAGQGSDFTGLSSLEAYALGDLDGDFDHDLADFAIFRTAFNSANGAGAFNAMLAGVPEPGSRMLALFTATFCVAAVGFRKRRCYALANASSI